MFDAYRVAVTLKAENLLSPELMRIADQLESLAKLGLDVNKQMRSLGVGAFYETNQSVAELARNLLKVEKRAAAAGTALKGMSGANIAMPAGLSAMYANGGGRGGGHGGGLHGGRVHVGPDGMGMGAVGVGLATDALPIIAGGYVAYSVGKAFYEGAKDYQDAFMRFKALNLGDPVNAEADKFVRASQTFGVSHAELMKALSESVGMFGGFSEAAKYTPMIAMLGKANSAVYGDRVGELDDAGIKSLLQFIDRRGGFKDQATFSRSMNLAERIVTGSGGFVKFQDLGHFSQLGGTAFRSLSDDGILKMQALILEQGGARAANAMMSMYQNVVAGRVPQKAMAMFQELGLADVQMQTHGLVGGKPFKSLIMTNVKDLDTAQASPVDWIIKTVVPAIQAYEARKHLAQDNNTTVRILNDLLSNRNASGQGSIISTQDFSIMRDYKLAKGAMGVNDVLNLYKNSAAGAEQNFQAAWADFKNQFGTALLPRVVDMLHVGTDMFHSLEKLESSPAFKAIENVSFGALKFFTWPYRLFSSRDGDNDKAQPSPVPSLRPYEQSNQFNSVAPAPRQTSGVVHTTIIIDGRKVANAVSPYFSGPLGSGLYTGGIDPTVSVPMPGLK